MNKKEIEIAKRSYDIIKKAKEDLLELCDGQSVSMVIAVLIAASDHLMGTAKDIRERATERKSVWDLIEDVLKETLK